MDGAEDGQALTLVNNRYQTFTVSKVYYNVWEHAFTGEEIPLEGTTIALYKKDADGNYQWVKNGKTDSLGQVTFEELTDEAGDEYVAVEVDIPQTAKDEYVYPNGNKEYLPDPTTDESVRTLTEANLDEYNYVKPDEANYCLLYTSRRTRIRRTRTRTPRPRRRRRLTRRRIQTRRRQTRRRQKTPGSRMLRRRKMRSSLLLTRRAA